MCFARLCFVSVTLDYKLIQQTLPSPHAGPGTSWVDVQPRGGNLPCPQGAEGLAGSPGQDQAFRMVGWGALILVPGEHTGLPTPC